MTPCGVKAGHRDVFHRRLFNLCREWARIQRVSLNRSWRPMAGNSQETSDCSSASSAEAGISIMAAVSVHSNAQRTSRPR